MSLPPQLFTPSGERVRKYEILTTEEKPQIIDENGSLVEQIQVIDADGTVVDPSGVQLLNIDAATTKIATTYRLIRTQGYRAVGDGGAATYKRVVSEPTHPGKMQDADGAWWELCESVVNPIMFGAIPDGTTPCDTAFNNMSAYVEQVKNVSEIKLAAFYGLHTSSGVSNGYMLKTGWNLPSYQMGSSNAVAPHLLISGHNTVLTTDAANIEVIKRIPTDQGQAGTIIGWVKYVFDGVQVYGTGLAGQTAFAIGATYHMQMRNCRVIACGKGFVLNFALQSYLLSCETINCTAGGFFIQDGSNDGLGGFGWSGGTNSNSQSNITVLQNCRVYGHPNQTQAFYFYASDSCALRNCVAEGAGGKIEVRFDYGGSPVVKLFTIDGLHCESANVRCLLKIRATGVVKIRGIFHQTPTALLDVSLSSGLKVVWEDMPYLVGASGDAQNPNNRLFFHTDGNGYGAPVESTNRSNGAGFTFLSIAGGAYAQFTNPAKWEGGNLPFGIRVLTTGDNGSGAWDYYGSWAITLTSGQPVTIAANLLPGGDNVYRLGQGNFRFTEVFAASPAINTSDAREKTQVVDLTEAEAQAAVALIKEIGVFQFLAAIEAKGPENARLHIGLTVQRAMEIMQSYGLNPTAYSFICYDEWQAQDAIVSEGTEHLAPVTIKPAVEAGNIFGLRHVELILFMLAGLAKHLNL
jgi:hypothetical protein